MVAELQQLLAISVSMRYCVPRLFSLMKKANLKRFSATAASGNQPSSQIKKQKQKVFLHCFLNFFICILLLCFAVQFMVLMHAGALPSSKEESLQNFCFKQAAQNYLKLGTISFPTQSLERTHSHHLG